MNASKKATQAHKTLVDALVSRDTKETKDAAKVITPHAIDYMMGAGIDVKQFTEKVKTTDKKSADFIAQKAVKRGLLLIQGLASGIVSTIPSEVSMVLAGFVKDAGKTEPNLFAQALLTRFIESDDLSELLTRKGVKISERGRKGVSTATAQASSVKSMLRGLGVGAGVKHGRQYGEIDCNHKIMIDFVTLLNK